MRADEFIPWIAHPARQLRVVVDTDAYNQVDDLFCVAHALLSPDRLDVLALTAAPFHNQRSAGPADGMEKSHQELLRLLDRLGRADDAHLAVRGSTTYLQDEKTPVDSGAARTIVRLADAATEDEPLVVLAIGAITNVASALLMAPELGLRLAVVWLGGQPHHWPRCTEFNLRQDVAAVNAVFHSAAAVIQIPTLNVAEHLRVTEPELAFHIKDLGPIGEFLHRRVADYFAELGVLSKPIWDLAASGLVIRPRAAECRIAPAPRISSLGSQDLRYLHDPTLRSIVEIVRLDRDTIFRDFYAKLAAAGASAKR